MKRLLLAFATCLLLLSPAWAQAAEMMPRKLVALYDSRYTVNLRENVIHRFLAMPANRLGFHVDYVDVNEPLPELDEDVYGILVWFTHEPIPRVEEYVAWLAKNVSAGKRLVVMESMGLGRIDSFNDQTIARIKYINERLGMRDNNVWHPITHKSSIQSRNPAIVDFERRITPPLPAFGQTVATAAGTSHLRITVGEDSPGEYSDAIITGPQGGYAAAGYAYHEQDVNDRTVSAWYINPFAFLRAALDPPLYPAPDITTRVGRRIFYSHIDGDGWNNRTHIEGHKNEFSSRIILDQIIKPYSDFAFSLGVVAGDVADECFGSEKSRAIARESLALPNVEAASHTYTHPLYWQFFENYSQEKEKVFAANFPKPAGMFKQDIGVLLSGDKELKKHKHDGATAPSLTEIKERGLADTSDEAHMRRLLEMYEVPRSYNCFPFDEEREITTAKAYIESLAPEGKKVRLLQWSGNTSPYERFLRKTREAGMYNINGGESRYDAEYPSYSTLYPIGIQMGDELQIYSTASNENTYTNLWSERFFGYRYLIETVRHTETPIRVAPFNVYFHSYSGERPGSLNALKEIMEYARKQELIPMVTSQYAAIANGFYTTHIETVGRNHWRIHDRGDLQTLRLPAQTGTRVDLGRSKGVLGQRMFQENLYIFLNPAVDKPEIMLIQKPSEAIPDSMNLTSSRWDILSAERHSPTDIEFSAQGYGPGDMLFTVPHNGNYTVRLAEKGKDTVSFVAASEDHALNISFGAARAYTPVNVRINLEE